MGFALQIAADKSDLEVRAVKINFDPSIQTLDPGQRVREPEKSAGEFAKTLAEVANRSAGKCAQFPELRAASTTAASRSPSCDAAPSTSWSSRKSAPARLATPAGG